MIETETTLASETENSNDSKLRVLVVEDDPADAELTLRELRRGGFDVCSEVVQTPEEFLVRIRANCPQIVLADYNLGHWRGMEALEIIRREGLDVPLILVSGALGDVTAVECIKQGATDYVLKDSLARLPVSIRRALRDQRQRELRQRAEKNLARKVEELARSNAELEQFAYVASYDLQEPLRMVANYTQLLAERYRGKLDEQADKYIHYAVDGATRMQTLIQDLLNFSRVGRQGPRLKRTDCNAVVEQTLKNLETAIKESSAVVNYDRLPVLMADGSQLVQLFQNLIGNALKFRRPETPSIHVNAEKNNNEWVFSVTDNGIGIAPEYFEDIFVIFKRLHTRVEYPGNGIGLAICRKIIEQHGGRIWVEPRPEPGSSFKFTLPIREEPQKNEQLHEQHSGNLVGR
jgi:signal transduction histidine kinase